MRTAVALLVSVLLGACIFFGGVAAGVGIRYYWRQWQASGERVELPVWLRPEWKLDQC